MNNYPVLLFHSTDDRDLLSLKDIGNIRPELFEKLIVRLKKDFDIIGLDALVGYGLTVRTAKGHYLFCFFLKKKRRKRYDPGTADHQ